MAKFLGIGEKVANRDDVRALIRFDKEVEVDGKVGKEVWVNRCWLIQVIFACEMEKKDNLQYVLALKYVDRRYYDKWFFEEKGYVAADYGEVVI